MSFISAGNTTTTTLVVNGDTTGNLVFNTGGANTTALTLTNTQGANFVGSVSALNTFGFKNRIINGNMVIDQRNAGASGTTTNAYTVDRWIYGASQASKGTWQQNAGSVTPPTGFSNYLGFTSSSAYTLGASDYFMFVQAIEGFNFADMAWGTANAKTITVSFQVYSSLTGTFGGALRNSAASRAYPFTYSIPTANTWTQISVTIAGDTSGTWVGATNGTGMQIDFSLGSGTTYSTTASAWATGNYLSATGATSVVSTNGATWYVTGVQVEVGSQATSFDFRSFGTEFALCQRYYNKLSSYGSAVNSSYIGFSIGTSTTSQLLTSIFWPVEMRTAPTITFYDAAGTSGVVYKGANGQSTYTGVNTTRGAYAGSQSAQNANELVFSYSASAEL
jgi:hypothetical protein